jgi:hypothetical protein
MRIGLLVLIAWTACSSGPAVGPSPPEGDALAPDASGPIADAAMAADGPATETGSTVDTLAVKVDGGVERAEASMCQPLPCSLCDCDGKACPNAVPPAALPAAVTDCSSLDSPRQDECACNGRTCPAGQTCIRVLTDPVPGVGGPMGLTNLCRTPCTASTDCGPGRECRPDNDDVFICQSIQCHSDDDCTLEDCGRCGPTWKSSHGPDEQVPHVHRCLYPGKCGPSSCAGCADVPSSAEPQSHSCAGG